MQLIDFLSATTTLSYRVSEVHVNSLTHIRPSLDEGQETKYHLHANVKLIYQSQWCKQVHHMNVDVIQGNVFNPTCMGKNVNGILWFCVPRNKINHSFNLTLNMQKHTSIMHNLNLEKFIL